MKSHTKHIEDLALQVLKKAGCTEAPVQVEKVAEAVDLEIIEFAFHEKISGLLKKDDGIIGVNKTHHPVRKRFTIAHELGHFLLGHGLGEYQEETIDFTFDKARPEEREANQFASSLLMPAEWVKKHIEKNGMDIEVLAKTFGVSKQAATIRILELNLV